MCELWLGMATKKNQPDRLNSSRDIALDNKGTFGLERQKIFLQDPVFQEYGFKRVRRLLFGSRSTSLVENGGGGGVHFGHHNNLVLAPKAASYEEPRPRQDLNWFQKVSHLPYRCMFLFFFAQLLVCGDLQPWTAQRINDFQKTLFPLVFLAFLVGFSLAVNYYEPELDSVEVITDG